MTTQKFFMFGLLMFCSGGIICSPAEAVKQCKSCSLESSVFPCGSVCCSVAEGVNTYDGGEGNYQSGVTACGGESNMISPSDLGCSLNGASGKCSNLSSIQLPNGYYGLRNDDSDKGYPYISVNNGSVSFYSSGSTPRVLCRSYSPCGSDETSGSSSSSSVSSGTTSSSSSSPSGGYCASNTCNLTCGPYKCAVVSGSAYDPYRTAEESYEILINACGGENNIVSPSDMGCTSGGCTGIPNGLPENDSYGLKYSGEMNNGADEPYKLYPYLNILYNRSPSIYSTASPFTKNILCK